MITEYARYRYTFLEKEIDLDHHLFTTGNNVTDDIEEIKKRYKERLEKAKELVKLGQIKEITEEIEEIEENQTINESKKLIK
jgi:hypothetical protein